MVFKVRTGYPLTVDGVDKRIVPDWREQYDRGIDVPFKSSKVVLCDRLTHECL